MIETNHLPKLEPRVRVYRSAMGDSGAELLGFADLVIADAFVIKDIRIVKPKEGDAQDAFVSFPSKKGSGSTSDKYFDIAHPITSEAYRGAREAILKAYQKAQAGAH